MKKLQMISTLSLCMAAVLSTAACTGEISAVPTESSALETPSVKTDTAASRLLSDMTRAIELQYPDQVFSDFEEGEVVISPLLFGGAYLYSGRKSTEGIEYIAAVCTTDENPLDSMTCGSGAGVPGFSVNQFDNGRILLLEKNGVSDSGLSYLYNALQQGEDGIRYLAEAGARGAGLIPPAKGPFLKVSMVKDGLPVTEFIALSAAEREKLANGTPVSENESWTDNIALCDSRDELSAVWNGGSRPVTEEMAAIAAEKCGFSAPDLTDINNVIKARLVTTFYGETRTESLENREDLELITSLLGEAEYTDTQYDRNYGGQLLLTKQDGETVTIQLALEDGGFILGNAAFYELSGEKTQAVWSVFSRTEGFRRFGNKISMEMENDSVSESESQLKLRLINQTGETIRYSLSPVLYKKNDNISGEEWKQIDTIGGFCGTNTETEAEETPLTIPWKGIFNLEGPGTYKIEIQVMPEQDLRFAISAEFDVK